MIEIPRTILDCDGLQYDSDKMVLKYCNGCDNSVTTAFNHCRKCGHSLEVIER